LAATTAAAIAATTVTVTRVRLCCRLGDDWWLYSSGNCGWEIRNNHCGGWRRLCIGGLVWGCSHRGL